MFRLRRKAQAETAQEEVKAVEAKNEEQADTILSRYLESGTEIVRKILHKPFTPGQITNALAAENLTLKGTPEGFVGELLPLCTQRFEAGFGEGYWSDHWDYDLDLVEDYLSVWPEKKDEMLFGKAACTWYDSPVAVRRRGAASRRDLG